MSTGARVEEDLTVQKDESDSPPTLARMSRAEVLTLLFLLLSLFAWLGAYGFVEDSEARYAEISWEMLNGGSWLTPHLNFIKHFHKPPTTFWLVALSGKLLGFSEWSARLPVVLAALGTVALLAGWPDSPRRPSRMGFWSVLVVLSTLEFWVLSRTILTDMFLCLTVVGAMRSAWQTLSGDADSRPFWVWLGLSMMVKGPVGPILVLLSLAVYSWVAGVQVRKRLGGAGGVLLFGLVGLPWYLWESAHNQGLLQYFLHFQTYQRFFTTVHGRGAPIWYFGPVLLLALFPWTLACLYAVYRAMRRLDRFDAFLLCWALVPLLVLSVSGSKLPTYVLPIVPAYALILGRELNTGQRDRVIYRLILVPVVLLALAVCLAAWALPLPLELSSSLSPAGYTCLLVLFTVCWTFFRRPKVTLLAVPLGFVVVLLSIVGVASTRDGLFSARRLADRIGELAPGHPVVAEYRTQVFGLPLYLGQRVAYIDYPRETQFENTQELAGYVWSDPGDFAATNRDAVVVLRKKDYQEGLFPGFHSESIGKWKLLYR